MTSEDVPLLSFKRIYVRFIQDIQLRLKHCSNNRRILLIGYGVHSRAAFYGILLPSAAFNRGQHLFEGGI